MELFATFLVALPTIFLAAFLAAAGENVRERMRTRRWVMRNLRELAGAAQTGTPDLIRAALRRWLAAESPEDLSEETWRHAWFLSLSNLPDLTPMLRSEAATAVPAEVFAALRQLEADVMTIKQIEAYLSDLYRQEIAPLWYERRAPLTGSDRRRVEHFALLFERLVALVNRTRDDTLEEFRRAVSQA